MSRFLRLRERLSQPKGRAHDLQGARGVVCHSHGEDILPRLAGPLVERRRAQTSTAEPQDQRSAHGFTAIGACEAANVAVW